MVDIIRGDETEELPEVHPSSALSRLREAIESAQPEDEFRDYRIPLKTTPRLVARFRMLTIDEQEQIMRARGRMREGQLLSAALDVLTNTCMNILIEDGDELIADDQPLTFTSPELATMLGVGQRAEEVIPALYPGGSAIGQVDALLDWSGFTADSAIEVNRGNSRKTQRSRRAR